MVIDNLDDIGLSFEYLPKLRGAILFTSRDGRIAGDADWGISADASVELLQMSDSEAFQMCANMGLQVATQRDTSTSTTEYAALAELLELLGYLPLAIAQAAAYIRRCGRRGRGISDYVTLFKESAERQEQLLAKSLKPGLPGSQRDARVIMATWKVTIDKIRTENPVAVDILQFMSALNPDGIPLELICTAKTFTEHDQLDIMESISTLVAFSFLSELDHSNTYRLHRLVSFSTRRYMRSEKRGMDLDAIAEAVLDSIPADQNADLLKCARMVPHAIAVEDQMGYEKALSPVRGNLQHAVASIMDNQGEYRTALEWYQRALEGKEKVLGKYHPSTLDTVNNMAIVFEFIGEYDKALEWFQRALEGNEKVLGKDHPSILDIVNNMANVFQSIGEYDKALEWYQRALEGNEKVLGKDHRSCLDSFYSIASLYESRAFEGDLLKAAEGFQRAFDGYTKIFGQEHSETCDASRHLNAVRDLLKAGGKSL